MYRMAYKFPTKRRRTRKPDTPERVEIKEEEEKVGLIQGQKPRSLEEWFTARALWALKLFFIYQYQLFGGTRLRGGIVIDFLVKVAPKWIPLEVQSARWHTGKFGSNERFRIARIERELGTKVRFVWEDQLTNLGDAISAVRRAIYGPVR